MRLFDDDGAPAPWLFKALIVSLILQAILLLLMPAGCAHLGPPPAPPPPSASQPLCDGDLYPIDTDVCEDRFTVEGNPCVLCDVPTPCFAAGLGVYCTPTCSDHECTFGPSGAKR